MPNIESQRIGWRARICWGMGSMATITYLNTVTALVMVYLLSVLKIHPAVAGALVTGARVFDALTDPAMGWLSDHTETRWGRRRPWLAVGAVICGLALPALYSLPTDLALSERIVFVGVALVFYSVAFTIFNVPYMTMPIEMSTDNQERITVMSLRVAFMVTGTFIGSSGAPYLLETFGRDAAGFSRLGWTIGAFVFVTMMITFLGTHGVRATRRVAHAAPLRDQLRTALSNRPFNLLLGVKVLQFIGIAANSGTLPFVVTVLMKRDFKLLLPYGLTQLACTLISLLFWRRVAQRMEKRRGFTIGVIGLVCVSLTWLFSGPAEPNVVFLTRAALHAFFGAAILLFGQAILLDAIDYDYRRTGLRREGSFTSVYVFVERLGYSIGPVLLGLLFSALEFDKNLKLEQQPAGASTAVMISICIIPALAFASSLLLLHRYDLTESELAAMVPPAQPGGLR
jgi:GPH family glycoside/pentoside/hexuronide:cation symporter